MQVGESLDSAWQIFKRHTGALVAATFALTLTQTVLNAILSRTANWMLSLLLSLLLSGLVMGGYMNVARIAARGGEPSASAACCAGSA
jgi:hypothetical protein